MTAYRSARTNLPVMGKGLGGSVCQHLTMGSPKASVPNFVPNGKPDKL